MRTRMSGGVGAGRSILPATRFGFSLVLACKATILREEEPHPDVRHSPHGGHFEDGPPCASVPTPAKPDVCNIVARHQLCAIFFEPFGEGINLGAEQPLVITQPRDFLVRLALRSDSVNVYGHIVPAAERRVQPRRAKSERKQTERPPGV